MTVKSKKLPFETALNMTGFGRFNLVMWFLTATNMMAMAFETFSVAYLVPASACELQTSSANQGLMAGMPLLGILLASNIWGYLGDTKGRRNILRVCLILGFLAGASATLSPNWIVFCFLKFLSASAMAGTFGLSITYLSEFTPEARRFSMILLISSAFLGSAGCMAALTVPIISLKFSFFVPYLNIYFNSWRLLNLIFSVPCAVAAVGLFFAYESPRFYLIKGETEQSLEVLRNIFVLNTGRSADEYKVEEVMLDEGSGSPAAVGFWNSVVSQTVPLLKPPLLQKTLLLSVLFVSSYFCINPFTVWLPYMADGFMRSMEKGDVGLTFCQMLRSSENDTLLQQTEPSGCELNSTAMFMVFGLDSFLAVLNVLLALLLPCFGRRGMFIAIQLISGVAALCVNASTMWVLSAVLLITFIAGILNFGFLSTFSVDVFPTYVKAMGVCLTLMVGRGSAVLGINILKDLLMNDCEAAFYVFGAITVFGGIVGFLLPRDKKSSDEKCPET